MAKFKDLSLDLETGEHIDFDDDDTIMMGYDGNELYISSTVSGIRAALPYHMVRYDQLTESSGTLQDQIDNLDLEIENTNEFIELTDTPTTYSGYEGYVVTVNASGTGVVFNPSAAATIIESPTPPDPDDANLWYNTVINDIFYYDSSRDAWLTTTSHNYMYSRSGAVGGAYLAIDAVVDASAHYWIPREASITGVIINMQETLNSAKTFEIRDWATTISGGSFTCSDYVYQAFDVDVIVASGTRMRCYVDGTGQSVKNVIAIFELRWRYDAI